jgi:hypothetical protein
MKRILTLITAAMLMFGVAGTASAAMTTGDFTLIAIGETNEKSVVFGTLEDEVVNNAFTLAELGGDDWSAVTIVAVANFTVSNNVGEISEWYNRNTSYVAVDAGETPTFQYAALTNFVSSVTLTTVGHRNDDLISNIDDNAANIQLSPLNSVSGFVTNLIASADLTNILTEDIWMDIWEYTYDSFADYTGQVKFVNADTGIDLHIWSEGGVIMAELTSVPVPGALVLLGSGLMALVGIRRKRA